MSPSALERNDLEQDIDELRSSIESLQSSRARVGDLIPSGPGKQPGTVWSDLTAVVTDFFEAAGAAISEPDGDEEKGALGPGESAANKFVTTDWSKALADAFGRLRDRISSDFHQDPSDPGPVAEMQGVVAELDSEIARLNAELGQKLDRVAELDRALEDADPIVPVHPRARDVADDDHTPVVARDDDIEVIPIPVDVLPDVDPSPAVDPGPAAVPDDDTDVVIPLPTPDVDVGPVVNVTPIEPDVVVTPLDDEEDTSTTDDEAPAYDPGTQTEIGELDGSIYDVNEILAAGRSVADLRRYDVPAGVVRDAGVAISAMLDGGYTLGDLREAGVPPADLHGLAGAADLRSAGYTVADLRDVFSLGELRSAYSIADLRDAGFTAAELGSAGAGWDELAASGFNFSDLRNAGASEATLRELFPSEFSTGDDDGSH